ncbi:hypothetical protein J1614_004133 [Plenodomus biglobosus]|nr:hypothetical protein J1614_004133 [Plenodomus biglobosus]
MLTLQRQVFSSKLVTIKVGATAHGYHVHTHLLMHHSGYFRDALGSDSFEEGKSNIVTLADIETHTFDAFIHWLYSGNFSAWPAWEKDDLAESYVSSQKAKILVYMFADRFLVPQLAKCISMSLFISLNSACPDPDAVVAAFRGLRSDSPLLRMLVDAHCLSWDPWNDKKGFRKAELPSEFYKRVAHRYAEINGVNNLGRKLKHSDYKEPEI